MNMPLTVSLRARRDKNSSNVGGVTAGHMGHNSSYLKSLMCRPIIKYHLFYWHRPPTSVLNKYTMEWGGGGPNPTAGKTLLRKFGNSVYPVLPVSFGGDTKIRRSLLSGVYARRSKISHQSALECVSVVDSTILREILREGQL